MQTQQKTGNNHNGLVKNLVDLMKKGNAHASLDDALKGIPFSKLGEKPAGLPYSIWQLAAHIRIAQWDILEFSRNAKHISPKWPDGYWPAEEAPESKTAWKNCIDAIRSDRAEFIELVKNAGDNLHKAFEYGDGQSLFQEALVLSDHNSYHTGELIIIRRLLNIWK